MHGAMRRIFQTRSAGCKISKARIAFAWRAMDAFYEEDGRIRVSNMVSFEPNIVSVHLDGSRLHLESGQTVIAHGPDRGLTVAEVLPATR